ncbi:MAG: 2-polyprenyl-3-methyl-6-methoxy-1,4-benzoquinone monooxygenase [Steroidobacterales bacterium]
MHSRSFTFADRVIGEIDKIIKVLTVPSRASRDIPAASGVAPALEPDQARESVRLMRVNHAGEVAAQALYQGQALTARDAEVVTAMARAAAEEADHLAWCERRITELGGRTSLLNPLWYAGSYAIGALAGAFGDRVSLGFIAETEKQVESHLRDHLERLPDADLRSRAILTQMKHDEIEHGARAAALGGSPLPVPLRTAMHLSSRLMTRTSYWL